MFDNHLWSLRNLGDKKLMIRRPAERDGVLPCVSSSSRLFIQTAQRKGDSKKARGKQFI
jgi:hypothetical protein